MNALPIIGPAVLILAGALAYWGTIDPDGRGYGFEILCLLLISMTSGLTLLKQPRSKALHGIAWASITIPIILIVYFLIFITSLTAGSFPE